MTQSKISCGAATWQRWLCSFAAMTALSASAWVQAQTPPTAAAEVFVQTGHSLHATMARFSPDGQRIATCDGLGAVIGWDAASGRQFREIQRHTGLCMGLAFTPDGQMVLSSGGARSGNDVVMSRWTTGEAVQSWAGHKGQVFAVLATNDSRGAWSLGDSDGIKRWALGQNDAVQTLVLLLPGEDAASAPHNTGMVLTRDQKKAFVARRDGSVLALDLSGKTAPTLLAKLPEAISSLALSADGKRLALARGNIMGSGNQDVLLLDTSSGQEVQRLKGHAGNVFALAFSPDGQMLASAAQIDTMAMINVGMKAVVGHEALRLWRVQDGALLAEVRNQRNDNGTPFVRGSLDFSAANPAEPGQRLALALWDEAVRVYEIASPTATPSNPAGNTSSLRLLHTLESRGLAPRQLRASDKMAKMMVADGRPRIAPKTMYLQPADIRREFGQDADWTPERQKRVEVIYTPRGMSTSVQRASMWDMKTGRLERVVDWQRGPSSDLGLDAQGRFTSVAPLFPHTILIAPLKTRMVRQATADADGQLSMRHFSYEPWDGKPEELFTPLPSPESSTASAKPLQVPHEGAYGTDIIIQSPTQQWTVVAGVPIGDKKDPANSQLSPRLFVQQRLADGTQVHRHDIAAPGLVRAMAISADERTLWVSGTTKGLPYNMEHQAWLLAVNLADGQITREWALAEGLTVDQISAHPAGDMAITNGGTNLSIWDKRQAERKYFIKASDSLRPVKALTLTADGKSIAASDNAGWTVLWDWPDNAAPVPRWARQLPYPSPHLLSFMANGQRLAAGSSDGAIRLLAGTDGSEIARMIRFDNDEWITIIPEGYFVASQDGDRWVNVRMDNRVYGIDQFYDVFYRPDIVERRLAGQAIAPLITVTLQDALRQPPPMVKLDLATSGTPMAGQKIKLRLQAQTQGGGVGEVRVMHNGKLLEVLNRAVVRSGLAQQPASSAAATPALAEQAKNASVAAEAVTRALRLAVQTGQDTVKAAPPPLQQLAGEVEVELVPGENSFSVIGFNAPGNLNARPVTRSLVAQGSAPAPRVFVLAVGVNQFQSANAPTLKGAVKDSSDFVAALRDKLGESYRDAPVVVKMLHNEQASRAGLMAALDELQKDVRSNDLLVWFVASHGTLDNNAQYGVILQDWDGKLGDGSLFSTSNILDASRRIKAFNQFVILDTCHAGGVNSLVRGLYDARLAVLARNMGLHVFASAADTEEAIDSYRGNGLFTHTLLKGLNTSLADKNGDRLVTINELGEYARRETKTIARSVGHSQEPLLMNFGKDITLYGIK
ncbi:MAG: caspase family protein [Pseudomonadota bacterium]